MMRRRPRGSRGMQGDGVLLCAGACGTQCPWRAVCPLEVLPGDACLMRQPNIPSAVDSEARTAIRAKARIFCFCMFPFPLCMSVRSGTPVTCGFCASEAKRSEDCPKGRGSALPARARAMAVPVPRERGDSCAICNCRPRHSQNSVGRL